MKSDLLIITAAGSGSRMDLGYNKMLYKHQGQTIIEQTVKRFISFKQFGQIIITCNNDDYEQYQFLLSLDSRIKLVVGGNTRQKSVFAGIRASSEEFRYVFVHDGARPQISQSLIERIFATIGTHPCYAVAVLTKDSIREVIDNKVSKILNRSHLYNMQTPQIIDYQLFLEAMDFALKNNIDETDEVALLYRFDHDIEIISGEYSNIKITTKEDLRSLL